MNRARDKVYYCKYCNGKRFRYSESPGLNIVQIHLPYLSRLHEILPSVCEYDQQEELPYFQHTVRLARSEKRARFLIAVARARCYSQGTH